MSKKHAEVKPSLNEWVVHIHGSVNPLAIAASRLLRDQYGGYTFTGPDGIIADFPPGTVSWVTRKPPAPRPAIVLPAEVTPERAAEVKAALEAMRDAGVTLPGEPA